MDTSHKSSHVLGLGGSATNRETGNPEKGWGLSVLNRSVPKTLAFAFGLSLRSDTQPVV